MKRVVLTLAALVVIAGPSFAAGQDRWTLAGNTGISVGNHTDPSFAWSVGTQRWFKPTLGVGIDAGRHRWDPTMGAGYAVPLGIGSSFNALTRGGQELQHLCGTFSVRGSGAGGSATSLSLGVGVYRQVIRNSDGRTTGSRDGDLRQGFNLAFDLAGVRAIAPAIQLRADWVDTRPRSSAYFTAGMGIHLNR